MKKILFAIFLIINTGLYAQTTHTINTGGFYYNPTSLTINLGDSVIWINDGGNHDVNGDISTLTSQPYNNPVTFDSPATNIVGAIIFGMKGTWSNISVSWKVAFGIFFVLLPGFIGGYHISESDNPHKVYTMINKRLECEEDGKKLTFEGECLLDNSGPEISGVVAQIQDAVFDCALDVPVLAVMLKRMPDARSGV